MQINSKGISIIKFYEGTGPINELGLYLPYTDSGGKWTIGYGCRYLLDRSPVTETTTPKTLKEIEKLMLAHLSEIYTQIDQLIKVELTRNQYSAICCFVYNLGSDRLRTSTLLKKLNAKLFDDAAKEILKWNKQTINGVLTVSRGLSARRQAEYNLFCTK